MRPAVSSDSKKLGVRTWREACFDTKDAVHNSNEEGAFRSLRNLSLIVEKRKKCRTPRLLESGLFLKV